jgi:Carboxypeptidase regulatory-like domain/TonB-dependent Receptor Plug Domain/TonB dependent receptor
MKFRLVLICVFLLSSILAAQTFRGTILGTVTDPSGNVIPGATVKARNTGTGQERTATTSGDGSYAIPELQVGTYNVTVTQSGFQTAVTSDVAVNVATERRVDVQLKVGQITQTVEVSGEALPQIETTSNDLGGVLTSQAVEDLPINGRDYTKLIFLNPGVAGSPDQITDSPGSFGEFSMNGARGRSNNYLLDGTDMNDGYRNDPAINQGGVFAVPSAILPIGAVDEMKVLSNFQPEYGRNAGAVVNIVTKSGSNKLHGEVFEYFRNDALDARNYFNQVGERRAPFHNNQFGGALGGPIIKDKTFFFFDYEGQRESVGTVTLACVPDPVQIAADLVALGPAASSVTQQMLKFWPSPNIPGTFGGAANPTKDIGCATLADNTTTNPFNANASLITPSYNNLSSLIAKIDHNFNTNNILTGRYFFGDSTQSFPLALTASGGQLPGFNTITPTRVQLVALSYVHTIGTNKVNEIRYGWNRFAEGFFPQDASFHPSSIGLCAASSTADCSGGGMHDSGLPITLVSVTPTGATSFFAQPGTTSADPRARVDTNNQFVDSFSWKIGKHDIKMGFEFRRSSVNQQEFQKYFRGRLKFADLTSFLAGMPEGGGFGSLQYSTSGTTARHTYENNFGLYLQDSFRLNPRLTVNYGLRWDYYGVIQEKNNLFANYVISSFDPSTDIGSGSLTQLGTNGLNSLYQPYYKNFSPRASIAWDVTGKSKTVIRAGAGLFYDAFSQDMFLGHLPYPTYFAPGPAYGNFGPNAITAAGASATTLANGIQPGVPVYGTSGCNVEVECDAFGIDQHIKTPYMENYNINIQQQLTAKTTLQVGYVGSQGHRLFHFYDINQPTQAVITASDLDCNCINDFSVPRPFSSPYGVGTLTKEGAIYVFQERSDAKSNYNSLQVSFKVNGWHGITSVVNYVYSKSLDTASDLEDFVVNAAQPQNSNNPSGEKGPSNFNIPNRLTWVLGYQFPSFGGSMQRLRNGWGFDSTVSLQSGQPFTLNYNAEDDYSGGGEGYDRPDVVGPIKYNRHNPAEFLDLSSFAMPCQVTVAPVSGFASDCTPGTRHYGSLGRNSLVGPTYKQWDFALYKNTGITEHVKVQLRAEFFNLLNHPNFSSPLLPSFIADPASNYVPGGAPGFAPGPAGSNREVGAGFYHIVATGDVGIGNPFLGGGGPRGIQLAAKFSF